MSIDLKSIRQDPKQTLKQLLNFYNGHTTTVLFVIAGLLIGFSLLRIQSLLDLASTSAQNTSQTSDEAVSLPSINLDEQTIQRLESIKNDTDVIIESKLPDDRTNPF